MKNILITIDTEGDNLWNWFEGTPITTNNACYLYRFQDLCNEYGFKPTYLTNYEMILSDEFKKFVDSYDINTFEIGMHLHAWNTPPQFVFDTSNNKSGAPYLIEYPIEVMEEKIDLMTNLITEFIGKKPVTHRAGRWAMNSTYFELLTKYGYRFDCSVTPHINWENALGKSSGSRGSDYTNAKENPYFEAGILELPMSIRRTHAYIEDKSFARGIYKAVKGQNIWLRPNGRNLKQMIWLADRILKEDKSDYLMFMLHSSEFMPGGSPTFRTAEDIEKLYADVCYLFKYISKNYQGMKICDYGDFIINSTELRNNR